jgi:chromate reductase, NAD(P)H dehydrogenase (quinone)
MARVVGISGALRKGSYNSALLAAAKELAPAGLEIEIADIHDVPLYDGDVEARGIPQAVTRLKDGIAAADALLLATPEYNNSVPGVLKNAVDWCTRPVADIKRVFGDKPVGLIGASTGARGTILSQTAWLPVLRTLGTRPFFQKSLYVAGAAKVFDGEGRLTDADLRERLKMYLEAFATFVAAR